MDCSKKDWKLLREKLPGWHEAYIDRLNHEYIELLNGKGSPSEKFWELNKRIREDKRSPGVQVFQRATEMTYLVACLLNENIIKEEELTDLSDEFRSKVQQLAEKRPWYDDLEEGCADPD